MDIMEIKKYLKEHKITYKMLAEMSGVPESTLKNIFGGFTPHPRTDTMEAIERALGINEKSPPVQQEDKLFIPKKYEGVMVAFNKGDDDLTQEDIDDVIKFIEFKKSLKKK